MNKLCLLAMCTTAMAMADSWSGTLVDVMCKGKDVAAHKRQ